MGILIDTSVLVEAERGRLDLEAILRSGPQEDVVLSAVTAAELLHGVHRLTGARQAVAERFVESLFDLLPVLPVDLPVARAHAALSADLARRGRAVGSHDLFIAATALVHDCRIATRDLRSFPRIDGLDVVRW